MQLLVSDANIILDVEEADLVAELFRLPWSIGVPDLLFEDELSEQHGHLMDHGLTALELSADAMLEVVRLASLYRRPSRYDCMALALARQENAPLLTGDAALRKAAERESVSVVGTIWVVETMVVTQLISIDRARAAYAAMRAADRRLPWDLAERSLEELAAGSFVWRDPF